MDHVRLDCDAEEHTPLRRTATYPWLSGQL